MFALRLGHVCIEVNCVIFFLQVAEAIFLFLSLLHTHVKCAEVEFCWRAVSSCHSDPHQSRIECTIQGMYTTNFIH